MDKKQLADKCGVSNDLIGRWMEKGLPYKKVGRKAMFDQAQVAEWLGQTAHKSAKYLLRLLPPQQQPNALPKVGDTVEQFNSMLSRAREVEQSSFRAWQEATPALKGVMEEQYMKSLDQLRKAEKDWPSIQIAAGEAMPRSLIEEQLAKILTVFKNALTGIGQSIALQLVGKQPAEIQQMINKAINEAIRDCCDEFGKLK